MLLLGALFCALALASESCLALAAARARRWLLGDPRRLTWASTAGGSVLVGLRLFLAAG